MGLQEAKRIEADAVVFPELTVTGYLGEDEFKWLRNPAGQKKVMQRVMNIADEANRLDPNMTVLVGFPLFYADKAANKTIKLGEKIRVNNPLYNFNNKLFNCTAIIRGGKILGISVKTEQPDGPGEYEPRQFLPWPEYMDVAEIVLPYAGKVKFGRVTVGIGNGKETIHLAVETCADAWPGMSATGVVNQAEQREIRALSRRAKEKSIGLIFNLSGSKPEPFLEVWKEKIRGALCTSGSAICGGAAYVFANALGLEAGNVAFEGGSTFAQHGKITHRGGERFSMDEVTFSGMDMKVPVAEKGKADVTASDHTFRNRPGQKFGGPAEWESLSTSDRMCEEVTRNATLWIYDYFKKTKTQGFVISLSGGQDSAYGATMVSLMIDRKFKEFLDKNKGDKYKALGALMKDFGHLKCVGEVLAVSGTEGVDKAIDRLKERMLTCVFLPSQNSPKEKLEDAQILINGDKKKGIKGIGGTLHVVDVQGIVDAAMGAFVTADKSKPHQKQIRERFEKELKQIIVGERKQFSKRLKQYIGQAVPSWANLSDDILLQNIQARARCPIPWMFAEREGKIACVTSNMSEAAAGYWTVGGDGDMGSINLCKGIYKSDLSVVLRYLCHKGLHGHEPIRALYNITQNVPSADLRKTKKGETGQTDEKDLEATYEQSDAIIKAMINRGKTPLEVYKHFKKQLEKGQLVFCKQEEGQAYTRKFNGKTIRYKNGDPLFASDEELIACIEKRCERWNISQFKRIMQQVGPFMGDDLDPHTSQRDVIFSGLFHDGRVDLKLYYLREALGESKGLERILGIGKSKLGNPNNSDIISNLQRQAFSDEAFRDKLVKTPVLELKQEILTPYAHRAKLAHTAMRHQTGFTAAAYP